MEPDVRIRYHQRLLAHVVQRGDDACACFKSRYQWPKGTLDKVQVTRLRDRISLYVRAPQVIGLITKLEAEEGIDGFTLPAFEIAHHSTSSKASNCRSRCPIEAYLKGMSSHFHPFASANSRDLFLYLTGP